MNYRNRDLLALARLAPCCMSCGKANEGDVVAAHANYAGYGKGMGLKAHDWATAALCGRCHTMVDTDAVMTGPERQAMWERAHRRTLEWMFSSGWLVVSPEARQPEREPKPVKPVRRGRKLQSGRKLVSRPSFPTRPKLEIAE